MRLRWLSLYTKDEGVARQRFDALTAEFSMWLKLRRAWAERRLKAAHVGLFARHTPSCLLYVLIARVQSGGGAPARAAPSAQFLWRRPPPKERRPARATLCFKLKPKYCDAVFAALAHANRAFARPPPTSFSSARQPPDKASSA